MFKKNIIKQIEVTNLMIARYAMATGDDNPLYTDLVQARTLGLKGLMAPPNFISSILGWDAGPPESMLRSDGTEVWEILPEFEGMRLMGGGQELEFYAPIFGGDTITSTRSLHGITEKSSRLGILKIAELEVLYKNQDNILVTRCVETMMAAPEVKS